MGKDSPQDKIKMAKLNLGCGEDIRNGYVNLDYVKKEGVDKVHNLNKVPYPFKDRYFDEIYASHVLEHLDVEWFDLIKELDRILKKGGRLIVKVPHFTAALAFIENHRRFFRYRSFESFDEQDTMHALDQKEYYNLDIVYRKIRFNKWPLFYNFFIEPLVNLSKATALLYENTFLRALFPAEELVFILRKK